MTRRNTELGRKIIGAIAVVQQCNLDSASQIVDAIMMVLGRCWGAINAAVHEIGCGSAFNWVGGAINMMVPLLDQRASAHNGAQTCMSLYSWHDSVQIGTFLRLHRNSSNWSHMTQYMEHGPVCFRTLCTVVNKLVQTARHCISCSKTSEK